MITRTSVVNSLQVDSISFSSIIQIGDSSYIQGSSRAIAVQREKELFFGNEGDFNSYPIFLKPIHVIPMNESISIQTQNLKPMIKVNHINIIGISASSVFQIGSNESINMESRVKHIRHLLDIYHPEIQPQSSPTNKTNINQSQRRVLNASYCRSRANYQC